MRIERKKRGVRGVISQEGREDDSQALDKWKLARIIRMEFLASSRLAGPRGLDNQTNKNKREGRSSQEKAK